MLEPVPQPPFRPSQRIDAAANPSLAFLSDAELRAIAQPLTQPAAIMRWFQRQGFEVKKKPNGMPLLSRQHFESVMGGDTARGTDTSRQDTLGETPNVAGFMRRFGKDRSQTNGTKAKN